jgi:hypothetical protein
MKTDWLKRCVFLLTLCCSALSSAGDSKSFSIRLERLGCFGACPNYVVTVASNGSVVWEGKDFVRVKGTRTSIINAKGIQEIRGRLNALRFSGQEGQEIKGAVMDGPIETTTIKHGGRTQVFKPDEIWPEGLLELQGTVDRVTKTQQWIFLTSEVLDELWWTDAEIRLKAKEYMTGAVLWNDGDLIRSLVRKGVDPNGLTDRDKWPYILEAVRSDLPNAVEALLDVGARMDQKVPIYTGHLFTYAALRTQSPQLVLSSFLRRGMPIDFENDEGDTSLMVAAQGLRVENVIFLVDHKAKVNHRGRKGGTPLSAAAKGLADTRRNFSFCAKPRDKKTADDCKVWLGDAQQKYDKIRAYLLANGAIETPQ